ncbi:MAG: undecaprenyl-diphosphate phosphatase [Actinomycetota bacterium]
MSLLQAIVLGAVQGLTEFIPISSSGHLVLVPEALSWPRPGLAFDVLLHAASLVALVAYFARDLRDVFVGSLQGDRSQRNLVTLLVVGTIPAGLAGLLLGDYFERSFEDAPAAAIQLIITAALLVGAELLLSYHSRRTARAETALRGIANLTPVDAGVIGVAQAISILPGISRSGASIGAGLALSMRRDEAARFAFLLAIPALLGASLVSIPDIRETGLGIGAGVAGFTASLVTSYAAIAGLIRFLRTRSLYPFAAYCVVAGLAFYLIVSS